MQILLVPLSSRYEEKLLGIVVFAFAFMVGIRILRMLELLPDRHVLEKLITWNLALHRGSRFLGFLQDSQWIRGDRELWTITEKGGIWLNNIKGVMESR
jgi:hypothetical protein